jgi:hypothetical protein
MTGMIRSNEMRGEQRSHTHDGAKEEYYTLIFASPLFSSVRYGQ